MWINENIFHNYNKKYRNNFLISKTQNPGYRILLAINYAHRILKWHYMGSSDSEFSWNEVWQRSCMYDQLWDVNCKHIYCYRDKAFVTSCQQAYVQGQYFSFITTHERIEMFAKHIHLWVNYWSTRVIIEVKLWMGDHRDLISQSTLPSIRENLNQNYFR